MKNSKGFTLVELVVVIAILGILAGIAIPRFLEATQTARGAKIVADMRTMESAVYIYYAKYGEYPADEDTNSTAAVDASAAEDESTDNNNNASSAKLSDFINGGIPTPPMGKFQIAVLSENGKVNSGEITSDNAAYYYKKDDVEDSTKNGCVHLGKEDGPTVYDLTSVSDTKLE